MLHVSLAENVSNLKSIASFLLYIKISALRRDGVSELMRSGREDWKAGKELSQKGKGRTDHKPLVF